jgi:hypothetical protein
MPQVNLSLKEIYKALCPKCKDKIVKMVHEKLTQDGIKQELEGKQK